MNAQEIRPAGYSGYDEWQAVALTRERAAYHRGRADGYAAGDADGYARCDAEWMRVLAPARLAARWAASTPGHAELERRRWGLGGREHFADPRPGDYRGADVTAAGRCRCGRPLLTRVGDREATCGECRLRPSSCECGALPVTLAVPAQGRAA